MFIDRDDFCQKIEEWQSNRPDCGIPKWTSGLFRSEAMTILVYYHHSGDKCFQYDDQRLTVCDIEHTRHRSPTNATIMG